MNRAVVAAVLSVLCAAAPSHAQRVVAAPPAPAPPATSASSDWCTEGLVPLDDETCFLLPDGGTSTLLVYLHGIIPPTATSPQKQNVERVVARAATRAHAAVLFPRGIRGIGPKANPDYWAWPTTAGDYAKYTPALLARFAAAKGALEGRAGKSFARTYLAGSSNGAYFLVSLALHGAFAADGFGAFSGGSGGGWSAREVAAMATTSKPFYVGYGAADETKGGPQSLATLLRNAKWPMREREHPGGHGAREVYLDEAFAYWESAGGAAP